MSDDARTHGLRQHYADASKFNARVRLHALYSTSPVGWLTWVFDQLALPPAAWVLELGCGPGYLWRRNGTRIPAELRPVLTDFSAGMLAETQRMLDPLRRAFSYSVADAQEIPFAAASYDAVIANHMLYHVPDKDRALGEIRRVLRPAGRFYASTLGETHMHEVRDLLHRFAPDSGYAQWFLGRINFTLENGADLLGHYFAQVELRRHPDELLVTEAEPLAAYVASTLPMGSDEVQAFTAFLSQEIAANGALHITSDSGMFIAMNDT